MFRGLKGMAERNLSSHGVERKELLRFEDIITELPSEPKYAQAIDVLQRCQEDITQIEPILDELYECFPALKPEPSTA